MDDSTPIETAHPAEMERQMTKAKNLPQAPAYSELRGEGFLKNLIKELEKGA